MVERVDEDARSPRSRIMDAVIDAAGDNGLAGVSIEDVARRAGLSRATVYRHFQGGRGQLVTETVTREVARFWRHLAEAVEGAASLEDRLVQGVMEARRWIVDYELLQRLLTYEPELIVAAIAESEPIVETVVEGYLRNLLLAESLRPGVALDEAASYLARMLQSYMSSPGRWDLGDEATVRRLVRTQFLGGIVTR